jgi:hypothetical protein
MCAPQGPNDHPVRALLAPIFASQAAQRGTLMTPAGPSSPNRSFGSRIYTQQGARPAQFAG